jgi:hypothetical protein
MNLIFLIDLFRLFQVLRMKISDSHKDSIKHPLVLLMAMELNLTQWVKLKNSKDMLAIKVDLDYQDHLLNKV